MPKHVLASHPEYEQWQHGEDVVEHRVRRRTGGRDLSLAAALVVVGVAAVVIAQTPHLGVRAVTLAVIALGVASRWGVLYQSLTPMPSLGVQLGTAKGLTVMNWEWKISHSKRFVPLSDVSTVVIHEGLVRWGVSYYLAVVGSSVTVAFEDVNPAPHVLEEVYHCAREVLFNEYADEDDEGRDGGLQAGR